MKQAVVGIVAVILLAIALGCAAVSEYVTPATVDQRALDYAASAGVVDPNDFDGYANLYKANRLKEAVDTAFEVNALSYKQMQERNELNYNALNQVVTANLTAARQREEALFSEKGILPLAAGLLGFGGLTGAIGLMRKRPGDITPVEMEQAVVQATGETNAELAAKVRQLTEVVKGVKTFMDKHPKGDATGDELRAALAAIQSTDTRAEVAVIKATG
jgi:hypothetical protein